LLDHAAAYLDEGRKDPAGAIVGVVFEDTIRRICRANGIIEAGQTCEPLINALTTSGVLSKLESKEAKAASDLRANATHAWWDKFNAEQVILGYSIKSSVQQVGETRIVCRIQVNDWGAWRSCQEIGRRQRNHSD
jgi:hypothetical protein